MAELTLDLKQSLAIATNEGARADVRALGLLSAAVLLIHDHPDDFDPDIWALCQELSDKAVESLEEIVPNG